jgi:hypothetical protein
MWQTICICSAGCVATDGTGIANQDGQGCLLLLLAHCVIQFGYAAGEWPGS